MARPRQDPSTKRSVQVNISLTPAEAARLKAQAAQAGLSLSAFVRGAALGRPAVASRAPSPEASPGGVPDFATRHELRRIGVNLNQIAKALNARREALPASLTGTLAALETLFDRWLTDGSADRKTGS